MKNIYKIAILLLGVILLWTIFAHYHLTAYLSVDGFNQYHAKILSFQQNNVYQFTLIYVFSYIVLITLCVPGTILFDLVAGFVFGPVVGLGLVLISYLSGAALNFFLVRLFLKDICHKRFYYLRHKILHGNSQYSIMLNLIGLRFIPVIPFWVLNILAAILDIPFSLFALTTFLGIIPTSLIYVILGHGVRTQIHQHQDVSTAMLLDPTLILPLFGLALLILLPNFFKKKCQTTA